MNSKDFHLDLITPDYLYQANDCLPEHLLSKVQDVCHLVHSHYPDKVYGSVNDSELFNEVKLCISYHVENYLKNIFKISQLPGLKRPIIQFIKDYRLAFKENDERALSLHYPRFNGGNQDMLCILTLDMEEGCGGEINLYRTHHAPLHVNDVIKIQPIVNQILIFPKDVVYSFMPYFSHRTNISLLIEFPLLGNIYKQRDFILSQEEDYSYWDTFTES